MKKTMLLGVLMLSAAAGVAQESRQDVSFSGAGIFGPTIHSPSQVTQTMTGAGGLLLSYRYMLTPHSALELNYSFAQDNQKYCTHGDQCTLGGTLAPTTGTTSTGQPYGYYRIHSRQQEAIGAYVYSFNFKRYSPFLEAGVGTLIFTPVLDEETNLLGTKSSKGVAGLMGGGLAYELSPSFDIRVEYRGLLTKTPSFGVNSSSSLTLNANRYEIISMPVFGVAYHF
jgi:opacity protein-like surface antigen